MGTWWCGQQLKLAVVAFPAPGGENADMSATPFTVSFVCTGNICRSPMGEVILRDLIADAGLADEVRITSSGTGDWHVGGPADPRTVATLADYGHDGTAHRAQQFEESGFQELDLVLALDYGHLRFLRAMAADETDAAKVQLLRSFDPAAVAAGTLEVDDPYLGREGDFIRSYEEIYTASQGVLDHIESQLAARTR